MIFVFQDHFDQIIDSKIAAHLIHTHRYQPSGSGFITTTKNNDIDDYFDGNDSEDEHQNGPFSTLEKESSQRKPIPQDRPQNVVDNVNALK